jgi:hypothetical protein
VAAAAHGGRRNQRTPRRSTAATGGGRGELVAIKIDPQLVTGGDVEMLEDLTVAAVRAAVAKSREEVKKEMEAATGGMNLQGLTDVLG